MHLYKPGRRTVVALAAAMGVTSCANGPGGLPRSVTDTFKSTFASDDPCSNNARNIGAVGGLLVGAVVGKAIGAKGGQLVAAAGVGALLGGLVGADMDRRRCDLAKVAKAHDLDVAMTDITVNSNAQGPTGAPAVASSPAGPASAGPGAETKHTTVGMSLTVFDHGSQFTTGSAIPTPATAAAFADIAEKYRTVAAGNDAQSVAAANERNRSMRILLVGHTDDTGSSRLNADLSEARARAIARIFAAHGFSDAQIFYQGAGEVFPIADNATEEGRARNRRVEVIDLSDDAQFAAFLDSRRPDVSRYRPAAPYAEVQAPAASEPAAAMKRSASTHPAAVVASRAASQGAVVAASRPGSPTDSAQRQVVAGGDHAAPSLALDFGGQPFDGKVAAIDIGRPVHTGGFSLVSTAYAAEPAVLGSCASDRPRISNRVKALGSGRDIKSAEYVPGTAQASWAAKVNGHLVGLTDVAVLRDGGQPASRPTFFIWKNYVEGSHAKPDLKTSGDVNAYQGDRALLYRVFPSEGPVRCIDMVIPNDAPSTAPASSFVYARAAALYQTQFSPTITR